MTDINDPKIGAAIAFEGDVLKDITAGRYRPRTAQPRRHTAEGKR
jgi:hypothetical protein